MAEELQSQGLEHAYIEIFGTDLGENDRQRIGFLEEVIEGIVPEKGEYVTLEAALSKSMDKDAKRNPDDNDGHSPYTKELLAREAVRDWYLQSDKEPLQNAKPLLSQLCRDADLDYVVDELEGCMKVLQRHFELKEFPRYVKIFDGALKAREEIRPVVVHETADYVIRSGNKEAIDYVTKKIAEYDGQLKARLEKAFALGDASAVEKAAKALEATGVPELQKYAQLKVTHAA